MYYYKLCKGVDRVPYKRQQGNLSTRFNHLFKLLKLKIMEKIKENTLIIESFTKKDLLLILNTYQNYINDFTNISEKDLDKIYLEVAKNQMKKIINQLKQ